MEIEEGMNVKLKNGMVVEVCNINDFREPSMRYAGDCLTLELDDVVFFGDSDIIKVVE